jgi:hypothetical protein
MCTAGWRDTPMPADLPAFLATQLLFGELQAWGEKRDHLQRWTESSTLKGCTETVH